MPLRSPRPVMAVAAISVVAAWTVLASAPAQADQTRQSEWWLNALGLLLLLAVGIV